MASDKSSAEAVPSRGLNSGLNSGNPQIKPTLYQLCHRTWSKSYDMIYANCEVRKMRIASAHMHLHTRTIVNPHRPLPSVQTYVHPCPLTLPSLTGSACEQALNPSCILVSKQRTLSHTQAHGRGLHMLHFVSVASKRRHDWRLEGLDPRIDEYSIPRIKPRT